ncbi:MAG: hypothetical protein AAAFM81_00850 [Pseudomonadota bacterium]
MTTPIIIVPGIMGTRLVDSRGRRLWDPNADMSRQNIIRLLANPAAAGVEVGFRTRFLRLGTTAIPSTRARASLTQLFRQRGIVNGGNLVWEGGYDKLVKGLSDPAFNTSCGGGTKLYAAGYDWRQSNSTSANRLKSVVERAMRETGSSDVILVAHSMGGHVARWFCKHATINGTRGHRFVRHLFLLGSPIHGASKAYRALRQSFVTADTIADIALPQHVDTYDDSVVDLAGRAVSSLVKVIPSVYELLPTRAFCNANPNWLRFNTSLAGIADASNPSRLYSNRHTGLTTNGVTNTLVTAFLAGRDVFDRYLGTYLPAQTTVVYSDSEPTETVMRIESNGSLARAGGRRLNLGDGTVPTYSASAQGNGNQNIPRLAIRGVDHVGVANHPFAVRRIQQLVAAQCVRRQTADGWRAAL